MRLPEEPEKPSQINIVPAIDVIFAILVYFIVSSLYLTRLEGLPVNLPQASTAEPQQEPQRLSVSIDRAGNLSLDGVPIALVTLGSEILARQQDGSGRATVAIVSADRAVEHGTVIAVMDELRKIPGVRLAIATRPPTEP